MNPQGIFYGYTSKIFHPRHLRPSGKFPTSLKTLPYRPVSSFRIPFQALQVLLTTLYEVMPMHTFQIRRALQSLGLSTCFALAALLFTIPATSSTASAQVVLSVSVAPPVLPVYTQPVCPGDGYLWTPGYWSYSDDGGYFWVPGTWVEPPQV